MTENRPTMPIAADSPSTSGRADVGQSCHFCSRLPVAYVRFGPKWPGERWHYGFICGACMDEHRDHLENVWSVDHGIRRIEQIGAQTPIALDVLRTPHDR